MCFLAIVTNAGEEKGNEDGVSQIKSDEAPYEFSLDPDTKAAEKKLRRVVAKQVCTSFQPSWAHSPAKELMGQSYNLGR